MKVKCQHTFTEKCHDTFITDYTPTQVLFKQQHLVFTSFIQEKKCDQSFEKNCHITYRPMVSSRKQIAIFVCYFADV